MNLTRRDFLKLMTTAAGAAVLSACAPKVYLLGAQANPPEDNEGFVNVRGRRFIDAAGREVIFNFVNIYRDSALTDLDWVKEWGFNGVRLVMFWSFFEPEIGQFSADEFARIEALVRKADELDLYVILDMHQDLWGKKPDDDWGRGAPAWTWEGNDKAHAHDESGVWSMAYFESEKIQYQFDRFWSNAPMQDGVGLLDHFIDLWQSVAARFADFKNVVGYDFFNEPFWGSRVIEIMEPMTITMLPRLILDHGPSVVDKPAFELALLGMTTAQSDPALYERWLDAGANKAMQLDRALISSAWDKIAAAIRTVDKHHILFTGPTLPANFGVETGIQPVEVAGEREPLYCFSAHVYDDDPARMQIIIGHIIAHANQFNTPLFLGEWGNLTNSDHIFAGDPLEATRVMLKALEDFGASRSYWHFLDAREMHTWFDEFVQRPYPVVLAGRLEKFEFDFETGNFICEWQSDEQLTEPSLFYLPARIYGSNFNVNLDNGEGFEFSPTFSNSENQFILVKPGNGKIKLTLTKS